MDIICQSCGMPLQEKKYFSTNADGSTNIVYCSYCYKDGEFIDGCSSLEEKIDSCVDMEIRTNIPKQKAEDMAKSILSSLSRWKR